MATIGEDGDVHAVVAVPCMKDELNVFAPPKMDTSASSGTFVELHPVSVVSGSQPTEFFDPGSNEQFTDLTETRLTMTLGVTKSDGTALEADTDTVAPINNVLHSVFSRIEVQFNDVDVTSPTAHYAYRAYVQNLLNYSLEEKTSHLTGQGYHLDDNLHSIGPNPPDITKEDPKNPATPLVTKRDRNSGLQSRFEMVKAGVFQYSAPVVCDVFNIEKYMLPGVSMRMKLTRSNDAFALMCGKPDPNQYKVIIKDVRLRLYKIIPTSSYRLGIEDALAVRNAAYHYTRSDTKTMTIEKSSISFYQDNLFPGVLPKRMTVGLVSSTAFSGSYKENPYFFHHYNMSRIAVEIDGRAVPYQAIKTDFSSNAYVEAYDALVNAGGCYNTDVGNGISMNDYKKGFTLLCFDLTSDKSAGAGDYLHPEVRGNLSLELNFRQELPHQVTLFILTEHAGRIIIDGNRAVTATHSD